MATLYIVGTPIGNLEDITLRALKVLSSVDLILCEDTRMTKRLLDRHGISKPTLSYHMHSKISRVERSLGLFKEGKNLALVSDAGTPGISDPGTELVARIREAFSVNVGVAGGPHLARLITIRPQDILPEYSVKVSRKLTLSWGR